MKKNLYLLIPKEEQGQFDIFTVLLAIVSFFIPHAFVSGAAMIMGCVSRYFLKGKKSSNIRL